MDRPNRPSALAAPKALPPQPRVDVVGDRVSATLPSGESVEVFLYGATILSWRDRHGADRLWLSEAAALDGSKAVRGGVPVVFPVFGPPPADCAASKLPQHGLARTSRWDFLGKSTSEATSAGKPPPASLAAAAASASKKAVPSEGIQLDFGLSAASADPALRALWPFDFGLIYSVTLEPDRLTTSIVVTNDGSRPFDFQVLLHTYLRVGNIASVEVAGLGGASFADKTDGYKTKTQPAGPLAIAGETDRAYSPADGAATVVDVLEGGQPRFTVTRDNLNDVVVWNPWSEKAQAMGDFSPKTGYQNMLCVEPGVVSTWQTLEPGDTFEGAQSITAH